jgi:hypothetical protein
MKTTHQILVEARMSMFNKLKRVTLRSAGGYTDKNGWQTPPGSEIIGWLSTKQNPAFGFAISKLTDFDKKWLKETMSDISDIYRISGRNMTTLAKFNLEKGTMSWFDNEHYANTDEPKFGKFIPYTSVFVDHGRLEDFNIKY